MNVHFQRFSFFLALCLVLLLPVCAAGSPESPLDETSGDSVETPVVVVEQGPALSDVVDALASLLGSEVPDGPLDSIEVFSAASTPSVMSVDPGETGTYVLDDGLTPSSVSGSLKSIMESLIGPYAPVVVQYRYQTNTSGVYSYVREIYPDYVWFCSCGVFALCLFCTFRLGGVLLRRI